MVKTKFMKISIITASYNSFPSIADALNSIAAQKDVTIEHVVVDGESEDQTIDAINKAHSVSKFVSEPDKGIYDALNKGVHLACGDIIGLLHSDDLFYSDETLKNIVETFNETQADVVYGDLIYVDKNNTDKVIRYWKSQPFKPALLKRGWMPAHPTIFMRKDVYEKHGDFDLNLKISADYDFVLRVFSDSALKLVYLPEVITKMRVGGASNRGLKNIILKSKEDFRVLKKNRMPFPLWILFTKNILKISQFLRKD
jgi:glycosyltransferase